MTEPPGYSGCRRQEGRRRRYAPEKAFEERARKLLDDPVAVICMCVSAARSRPRCTESAKQSNPDRGLSRRAPAVSR